MTFYLKRKEYTLSLFGLGYIYLTSKIIWFLAQQSSITCSVINSAFPGKHYDAPARREVEVSLYFDLELFMYNLSSNLCIVTPKPSIFQRCFEEWKAETDPAKRKEVFIKLMKEIKLSKLDNTTLMTGIVTPPAAMAAKRAGEFLPHLSFIKSIPDVVFVPSVTMAALVISKLSRRLYSRNVQSEPKPRRSSSFDESTDNMPRPTELSPSCPSNWNRKMKEETHVI